MEAVLGHPVFRLCIDVLAVYGAVDILRRLSGK